MRVQILEAETFSLKWLGWISQEALRICGALVRQIAASKSSRAELENIDPQIEDTNLTHAKASGIGTVFPVDQVCSSQGNMCTSLE